MNFGENTSLRFVGRFLERVRARNTKKFFERTEVLSRTPDLFTLIFQKYLTPFCAQEDYKEENEKSI